MNPLLEQLKINKPAKVKQPVVIKIPAALAQKEGIAIKTKIID